MINATERRKQETREQIELAFKATTELDAVVWLTHAVRGLFEEVFHEPLVVDENSRSKKQ